MHKTPPFHASRFFAAIASLLALLVLSGCNLTITNLTPATVPQNPSNIYTLTASFQPKTSTVDAASIQPRVIIDGQSYNMTRSAVAASVWEFEYQFAPGRTSASYYFICEYSTKSGGAAVPQENYTELYTLAVNSRYVLRADATRAPVGARVNVVGAGLTPQDVIYFGDTPTRTVYESPASLSFYVPSVAAGMSYQLRIAGPGGELPAGTFRVDGSDVQAFPSFLSIRQGDSAQLTFSVPMPAPAGGMLIEVTTDVPTSIIMPEVIIPAGATSAVIAVQGGKPGSGTLYYKTLGGEAAIAVTVTAR